MKLRGQYVDGHEHSDVVEYRDKIFIPKMQELLRHARKWAADGTEDGNVDGQPVVLWFHDESTFYAHDRKKTVWVHDSANPKPYAKGEGHSIMVADFVSADYGWLQSPDRKECARVLFRAGKGRDGYFDNEAIRSQASKAMEILKKCYPTEKHVLIFDNAATHRKRADDALSALKMPKGPSSNFFAETNAIDPETGETLYGIDGSILKNKVRMTNGAFHDGTEQDFYFPVGHPKAGQFKGMVQILEERGYNMQGKRAQCGKKFSDCPNGSTNCCCRRMMYNEPDFVVVESLLEIDCKKNDFTVIFLPKFHCELNFIEQCWGHAKRRYRTFPASSNEADLEKNINLAIEEIPLIAMRR
jgi:hypothetical protein